MIAAFRSAFLARRPWCLPWCLPWRALTAAAVALAIGFGTAVYAANNSVQGAKKDEHAFDGDAPTAQASRKELMARSAESGQRIYAVHFPFPGLGKFTKQGDGFVWTPE